MRTVRPLREEDAAQFALIRRESLLESPLSFAASAATDVARWSDGVIGAFEDERLVGIVGVLQARHEKSRHKAHVWGMYVLPAFRNRGIGAELLDAALRHVRSLAGVSTVHLSVTSAAPAARHLYERAGFEVWGVEPDALRHAGDSVDEYHMALRL
ncbi:MAG: GNAT family N-acetyltransferase [Thermoanaerobaculia bacterium]